MFPVETLMRDNWVLQFFQWIQQGERMNDFNASSEDTNKKCWRTPMFPVETLMRDNWVRQCFQWRHRGEMLTDSNVSRGDNKERIWRTPKFPVKTPMRNAGGLQCFHLRHQGKRMEDSHVSSRDTEERGCRIGCSFYCHVTGIVLSSWYNLLLYIISLLEGKSVYSDHFLVLAILFMICTKNSKNNTSETVKIIKRS